MTVVINPAREVAAGEVDQAEAFIRQMARMTKAHPRDEQPYVEVWLQVRGEKTPVVVRQMTIARAIREAKRDGADERGQLKAVADAMDGGDEGWRDVERVWKGRFDPHRVKLPPAQYLDEVQEREGAADSRLQVRCPLKNQ